MTRHRIVYVILEPHKHLRKAQPHFNTVGVTTLTDSELAKAQFSLGQVVSELKKEDGDRFFVQQGVDQYEVELYQCEECHQTYARAPGLDLENLATAKRASIVRRFLLSNEILLLTSILSIVCGVLASMYKHDFAWFARSGAIVVAVGIAILSRYILLGVNLKPDIYHLPTGLSQTNPDHYKRLGLPVPSGIQHDYDLKLSIGLLGPIVSFIGTIIWGFGDLLNLLIKF